MANLRQFFEARIFRALAAGLSCAAWLQSALLPADSKRGEQLFQTLSCVQCHAVNGVGGRIGPDLGRRAGRDMTPSALASAMWNHAPTMWNAMRTRGIHPADLNEQAAADLLAYFYAAHFFEKPGNAGRGKKAFDSRHCSTCHGISRAKHPEAKPVSQWTALGYPMEMVNAMWNHTANMREEFSRRHLQWPELTSQDLVDILVYLRNLPAARGHEFRVEISSGAGGEAIFETRGCSNCHTGDLSLVNRLKGKTLTDIAVDMWNHEPRMPAAPSLTVEEMRELTSYLWAEEFFADSGSAARGERVFARKQCALCHNDPYSGAPKLTGRSFTTSALVSGLWRHGPAMLDAMEAKKIPWPQFGGSDMADLIAFLNNGPPPPQRIGHGAN